LISLKIYGDDLEEVISELINQDFLNEERYARSYARGKFRIKKWGRNKIKQQLQARHVSAYCIKKGMEEIEEEDYLSTLNNIIDKTASKYAELDAFKRKDKVIKYAFSRGFEAPLIFEIIRERELDKKL